MDSQNGPSSASEAQTWPRPASTSATSSSGDRTRQRRTGVLYGLLAAVIWGGFLSVSGHGIAAGLGAADLAFLRCASAGILLLPWLALHSPATLAGVGWTRGVALASLVGPVFILVGASGYRFAPVAHGAVIQPGMVTVAGVLLAAVLLGERPTRRQLGGLAILLGGLAVIAGPGLLAGSSTAWVGDLLFALAGAMFATFTLLVRHWRLDAFAATVVVSVLPGIVYTPVYLILVGTSRLAAASVATLLEQAVVQGVLSGILALFAFGRAVALLGAGPAALFPALTPAVAVLIAVPLVGEVPSWSQSAGLLIATAGLLTALGRRAD